MVWNNWVCTVLLAIRTLCTRQQLMQVKRQDNHHELYVKTRDFRHSSKLALLHVLPAGAFFSRELDAKFIQLAGKLCTCGSDGQF